MYNGMEFESLTLENGLQLLAISDPRFVKSSAALAVMAGSMQNPEEHLGLAHFLEHMLFLGTEEYPQVGAYEDFLNKNGGGHNAYTSLDHTNYFFDVTHAAFEGALQRFSRFFVSPTFDPKYVEREKNAVHSEHEKNYKDDGRREHRFLQMITDPRHPFSKFATGDKNTLSQANRDIVMKFYQDSYSSNLMRLVLMSPLPVKEIQDLAKKYFCDIANKKLPMPSFNDKLFAHLKEPLFHKVQTVRDQQTLKLSFSMPDDMAYWKSKPTGFLAHLIGEEGEGSLLSFLKKRNWASGLETSTWWRMFHVRVKLTDEGKEHIDEIIKTLFAYIELIKQEGLKKYLFEERQVLAAVELDNIEPKSSMGRASNFSAALLYYPADEFLKRYYLYHEHSQLDFDLFLKHLNVDNMQVTYLTNKALEGDVLIEPYYGIQYKSEKFNDKLKKQLEQIEPLLDLHYPAPNPYIPKDLGLIDKPQLGKPNKEVLNDYTTLYSQVDTELGIPKASLSITLVSDRVAGDPKKYLLAKLYARLKNEELNEWGYPARLAGLNFHFSFGYNSLTLESSGYSEHLVKLLKRLIWDETHNRRIDRIDIEPNVFERIKLKFKRAMINKDHDAAYQHLMYELGQMLTSSSVHRKDYIHLIDEVTLEEVNQFASDFCSRVSIRTFSYGNIEEEKIKEALHCFNENISAQGFVDEEVEGFENKFVVPPEKATFHQIQGLNNNNSQLSIYPLAKWSIKDQAYISIISKVLEQPFFTELRTHQQLGYVVAAFGSVSYGFTGIGTLIQSQTHNALDIYNRSKAFLDGFLPLLANQLTSEDLESIKQSLILELAQKPNSLSERLGRFTIMAGTYHGDFQFFDKLIAAIGAINLESLGQYINQHLAKMTGTSPSQHMCLLYHSSESKENKVQLPDFDEITDIQSFQRNKELIQPYKRGL